MKNPLRQPLDWFKRKSPSQWLMDNWKRERGALYLVILAFLVMELTQNIILMAVYLK